MEPTAANRTPFHLGVHDVPIGYHGRLLADPHRMSAYERALRQTVRPGDVVLDVGAGTGILSMLAARCGARRVHAVESGPVADVAAALIAHNGLEEQIQLHRRDLLTLEPVEPVDVVVSDFLGCFVVDDGMLATLPAARRWMGPNARFIPHQVRLKVAPVEMGLPQVDIFRRPLYGLSLRPALQPAENAQYRVVLAPEHLLGPARELHLLSPPGNGGPVDATLSFRFERSGTLQGVAGWFEASLAPGVELCTGPGIQTHWGQLLFPLPRTPVTPETALEVRFQLEEEASTLIWHWEGQVGGHRFRHSSGGAGPEAPGPAPEGSVTWETVRAWCEQGGQALEAGRSEEAAGCFERVVQALGPEDRMHAPGMYENLGIAWQAVGEDLHAVQAFWRALDGDPASREQSARLLIRALYRTGRHQDGQRALEQYRLHFGTHPEIEAWFKGG